MNMLRRTLIAATTALAVAGLIAACGGGSGEQQLVNIIALNDFHGNIEVPAANNGGSVFVKDPANAAGTQVLTGGAAYLATLINKLRAGNPNTIVVGAGDLIGAAPVLSTLTHQEATIDILNMLGLEVSAVGNHEFDQGRTELLRMQNGGCFIGGTVGTDTCLKDGVFSGAKFKYLAANVTDAATGNTILPATHVKKFGGLSVGFVGLTLKATPSSVLGGGVAGLSFLDEAATINKYAAQLRANGANAVVVLIHQGGQTTATTINDKSCPGLTGEILPIVDALTKDVDVVVSGHTHQEYVCTRNGKLLTSTGFYGSAVTNISMTVTDSGVTSLAADNIPVINDTNKTLPSGLTALTKDSTVDAAIQFYLGTLAKIKNLVVGTISADIKRALLAGVSTPTRDETAEGAMGDVVADFYLAGVPKADFGLTNPGGVRADLIYSGSGNVTYGDLLTVAPFGNDLVTVDMTGAQIIRLLEQQWEAANCAAKQGVNGCGRLLQPSAEFKYSWDAAQPSGKPDGQGNRVIAGSVTIAGLPLDLNKTYRVATASFLGQGGDNFTQFRNGANYINTGVKDIDAFVNYVKAHPGLTPPAARITRVH